MKTGFELVDLLRVDSECLPSGVRAVSLQFNGHRQALRGHSMDEALREIKDWIVVIDSRGKLVRYLTNYSPFPLCILAENIIF